MSELMSHPSRAPMAHDLKSVRGTAPCVGHLIPQPSAVGESIPAGWVHECNTNLVGCSEEGATGGGFQCFSTKQRASSLLGAATLREELTGHCDLQLLPHDDETDRWVQVTKSLTGFFYPGRCFSSCLFFWGGDWNTHSGSAPPL